MGQLLPLPHDWDTGLLVAAVAILILDVLIEVSQTTLHRVAAALRRLVPATFRIDDDPAGGRTVSLQFATPPPSAPAPKVRLIGRTASALMLVGHAAPQFDAVDPGLLIAALAVLTADVASGAARNGFTRLKALARRFGGYQKDDEGNTHVFWKR
ncbi:hypothetical protein [Streptomyces sp. Tue6028]|uniref:hypothetical protein n=1 Tax=Streptomyces sp. Tue6028 TaxID=2036037 RepID=UPI003EB7AF51